MTLIELIYWKPDEKYVLKNGPGGNSMIHCTERVDKHIDKKNTKKKTQGPGGNPMILIELINGPTLDHFLASMEGMLPHWRKQRPTVAAWAKGLLKGFF